MHLNREGEEAIEAVKLELCLAIERVILRYGWTHRLAAAYMGTSRANVSRLANKRLDQLTVGQLFLYLAKICPGFRFMLSIDQTLSGARPR
jgi:predicted XRE-type DNA-binding protein